MILAPVTKAHWKDFLIPAAYTDVGKLIDEEPRPDVLISALHYPVQSDGQSSSNDRSDQHDAILEITDPSDMKEGSSGREDHDFHVPADPSGIPDSKASAERSSPGNHIGYIIHRNLEHILSVCSIPLQTPRMEMDDRVTEQEVTPVALTCGDMSFHRISVSSSL